MTGVVEPSTCGRARRALALVLLVAAGCGAAEDTAARIDVDAAKQTIETTQERVAEGAKVAASRLDGVRTDLERAAGQLEGAVGDAAQQAAQQTIPSAADEASLVADAEDAIHCADDRCEITRDYAMRLRGQPTVLASQARVQPYTRDGRVVGMRVAEARKLPELLGLRAGDVITRVNGLAITSMQAVPSLYLQLRAARRFTIEYERGGEARTLVVDVV